MSKLTVVAKSMSSLEIAELTGKEHRNVMSDIRKMLDELNIDAAMFSATYKAGRNNTYECFNLPKRETLILVSGYSVSMRASIIDRWQELEAKELLEVERKETRQQAKLDAPLMTKSLADMREREGKESPPHIFSNEHNMIYRIVLGFTAKKYKEENGIGDDVNLRDVLSFEEIKALEQLQKHNTTLIELDFSFEQRKTELTKIFMRNHSKPMIAEIERLNA